MEEGGEKGDRKKVRQAQLLDPEAANTQMNIPLLLFAFLKGVMKQ